MTSFFIPRGLRVREVDSNPSVIASELVFPNATLSASGTILTVQGLVVDGDKGDITVSASGATWTIDNDAPSIADKVVGPASSTDNAVARFDATTGKLIQNSSVVVTDDGSVGIGTTSPDKKLVIDGSTGSPGLSVRHTARSGGGLDISSGNNRSSIFNSDALPLRLGVDSTTAINISSTNEVTFPVGVALGTPLSGVATNLTGTAAGLTAGNVTTNANLTGHVTSVGNAAVLGSFTKAQLDAAVSDGNVLYVGDVTSNVTHTGDVTGDTALTIANSAVTLAKMANLAQDQFIGRTTASTGVPETATITAAARTVLDDTTVAAMLTTLGGIGAVGTTLADIFSVSGTDLVADNLAADKLYGWDDSESKAIGFIIGSGLSVSGDTLSATASGGSKTYAVFTATDNQPPATVFATLDTRNSIAVLDFDDATDESAVFMGIIPEAASLGSGLKIRLHWMATTATSGNVVWDVSLERMTTDLDSDSFDTIASGTAAANGTSGILTVTEITLTTIDSVTAGDGYRLKVTRDADNGSDTMTGDAELVVCEVRSAA